MKMKNIFLVTGLGLALLVSCQNADSGNKEARLARLLKQKSELENQILALQAELGKGLNLVAKPVEVKTVQEGPFAKTVLIQGMVDGDAILSVNPQMPGAVTEILVKTGQTVKKGQLLAKIDDAVLQRNLNQLAKSLELANTAYERQKKLWDEKLGSEMQYLQAKNTKESLEANIAAIQQQIDMCLITAPVSGTIAEYDLKLGQVVSTSTTAFLITNLTSLKVVAEVSELYSAKVKTGDSVKISFPDIEESIETRITSVSNYINPASRTFTIETQLPVSFHGIKANMIAKVEVADYSNPAAISVPLNVVTREGDKNYVFVVVEKDGKYFAERRYVTVGVYSGTQVEIMEGLASGERIIVTGNQLLTDQELISFPQN